MKTAQEIIENCDAWLANNKADRRHISLSMAEYKIISEAFNRINTPEIDDFMEAVQNEAKHQRLRWGVDHDAGKTNSDWFWLIGYVAGKALNPKNYEKQLHHIITTAAVCLNWHSAKLGLNSEMRPGIDGEAALKEKGD